MPTTSDATQKRVERIKQDVRSITTCPTTAPTSLQHLLERKSVDPVQKENVTVSTIANARRTKTPAPALKPDLKKETNAPLSPRERYILATEVANATLKALADTLKTASKTCHDKSPPSAKSSNAPPARKQEATARPHTKKRTGAKTPLLERSVSQVSNSSKSQTSDPTTAQSSNEPPKHDTGLVAVAECAIVAFSYLATPEAISILGEDAGELQVETGMLALVGKLVALDLDTLAVREIRILRKRILRFLGLDVVEDETPAEPRNGCLQIGSQPRKESLAILLQYGIIEHGSAAVPIVANLQIYVLRIIAKMNRPPPLDSVWQSLDPVNSSSPANLLLVMAKDPANGTKVPRQLEMLAQIILAICPSISRSHDDEYSLPAADIVLRLQQLALKVRKTWWPLAKHRGQEEKEILEPFAKCLVAFARRSEVPPVEKYRLVSSLLAGLDLRLTQHEIRTACNGLVGKTLCSLAQSADMSAEAVEWLQTQQDTPMGNNITIEEIASHVRIAMVSLDSLSKGKLVAGCDDSIQCAFRALAGAIEASGLVSKSLNNDVNTLRRVATRLLMVEKLLSKCTELVPSLEQSLIQIVASTVRFTGQHVAHLSQQRKDRNVDLQDRDESLVDQPNVRSIIDSVVACFRRMHMAESEWRRLDDMLQDCKQILKVTNEHCTPPGDDMDADSSEALLVKLSNIYWTIYRQLRGAKETSQVSIEAMQRSVEILQPESEHVWKTGQLLSKLEQLADVLESSGDKESSRAALEKSIKSQIQPSTTQLLTKLSGKYPVSRVFSFDERLRSLSRVLKVHHRCCTHIDVTSSSEIAFYDDFDLPSEARGILLEHQLSFFLRLFSKHHHDNVYEKHATQALTERLLGLYDEKMYPIRRMRLRNMLLDLARQHHGISIDDCPAQVEKVSSSRSITESKDASLQNFDVYYRSMHLLKQVLYTSAQSILSLRDVFAAGDRIVQSCSSWDSLTERIDNVEEWVYELETCVQFLNNRGEEYIALPVLQLLVKIGRLRGDTDASTLVEHMCTFALQSLRLGYTGKCDNTLSDAQILLSEASVSTEAKLRWHIANAEFLISAGNIIRSTTIISRAQKIATADADFMQLSRSSTPFSGRLRFNRILADAAYVQALLATCGGHYKEAARYARQCVTLNRRLWAALELRSNVNKSASLSASILADSTNKASFESTNSMTDDKKAPLVQSITHDALRGPEFWSLVPALYRGLMQHSQIFAFQGLYQEATHIAEQASKVASATGSATLIIDNVSWRADCLAQSGRPDAGDVLLQSLGEVPQSKSLSTVAYYSAKARCQHWHGQYNDEIATYERLAIILDDLTAPSFIQSLYELNDGMDDLVEKTAAVSLEPSKTPVRKPRAVPAKTTTRARKPATRMSPVKAPAKMTAAPRSRKTTNRKTPPVKDTQVIATSLDTPSTSDTCSLLRSYQSDLSYRSVLANVLDQKLSQAMEMVTRFDTIVTNMQHDPLHQWTLFKAELASIFQQVAGDFGFNTLPESTIAFPAINIADTQASSEVPLKRTKPSVSTKVKAAKTAVSKAIGFETQLQAARNKLIDAHAAAVTQGPSHILRQISTALSQITVLLSAVNHGDASSHVSPHYTAYMSEISNIHAHRIAHDSLEVEQEPLTREDCLSWPESDAVKRQVVSVAEFGEAYIDTLPETWTAVSLALNDTADELFITRFRKHESPFVLRLPLARHASRDVEEEEFTFQDGKRDFEEIIELNDFSTRTAKDMTSKAARQQWWAEREALDTRLHELLVNMENIWLGGFKGVFSQHERQEDLLGRFRNALEKILNGHLPSRRKKGQQATPTTLDMQVLELFIGLGSTLNDEENDIDEPLMDLIYFVVDILHFHGEHNAYDEIDFDAIVVEVLDALRDYHCAMVNPSATTTRHVILILDNNLHRFPWESLPCLEDISISRLPSLAALRERLLTMHPSQSQLKKPPGHYIDLQQGGTSILNPSGDLSHTLKTIQPHLNTLCGPWTHIANRALTEPEFESALQEKDLVLYFGHGSGAQYIRTKSVRRLYTPQHETDHPKPSCATTFLFGCSSVHLNENGIFEPSGMLAAYLTAGAPAVVGMLWDVTDKDCDRFAVKLGEEWGLWKAQENEVERTIAGKGKGKVGGKGRVARLVQDAEGAADGTKAKGKGKKAKADQEQAKIQKEAKGLDECVRDARDACVLRYLNGAAAVVYGIPVYLEREV